MSRIFCLPDIREMNRGHLKYGQGQVDFIGHIHYDETLVVKRKSLMASFFESPHEDFFVDRDGWRHRKVQSVHP